MNMAKKNQVPLYISLLIPPHQALSLISLQALSKSDPEEAAVLCAMFCVDLFQLSDLRELGFLNFIYLRGQARWIFGCGKEKI